jgi:signal transduction histidine kinase
LRARESSRKQIDANETESNMTKTRILIVDDEEVNVRLLEQVLRRSDYSHVLGTSDSREAAKLFAEFSPDLVLLDLHMPHMDGFEVLEKLRELTPPDSFVPMLVLTADISIESKRRALAAGANDFLPKPFNHTEVLLRIKNLSEMRSLHLQLKGQNEILEKKVRERTAELQQALDKLAATQRQAIQQERLSALGAMARGMAHDLNESLSVVLGYSEMVLNEFREPDSTDNLIRHMQAIISAARDGARMVSRLGEFQRTDDETALSLPVDLNALAEEAVSLTKPRWKSESLESGAAIEVVTELKKLPPIIGKSGELRRALTELIFNAIDAMPRGGTIALRTRNNVESVALEISDTGAGMSENVRQRCVEPFFTTKTEHVGLGLATVYGCMKRHGGEVTIESEPGKGTTVRLSFPIEAARPAIEAQPAGGERPLSILVVDDQPIVCDLLAQYLRQDWHTVETATDGREALEKFKAGRFDLVITDQAMAGFTGSQLAAAVKEINPGAGVILLTGFLATSNGKDQHSPAIDLVVRKPASITTLREAIAKVAAK